MVLAPMDAIVRKPTEIKKLRKRDTKKSGPGGVLDTDIFDRGY
ncbi:hypothetical protein [Roseovarius amoyensis]|nr:hypothetical protein [Roseovarius amoyensis]